MANLSVLGTHHEVLSDLANHARSCAPVLGEQLTAYVAGADSVAQFEGWLAGTDAAAAKRAVPRLAAVIEVIRIFAADNLVSRVPAWLRAPGEHGEPAPARLLRVAEDDEVIKKVLPAAAFWVTRHRPTARSADGFRQL